MAHWVEAADWIVWQLTGTLRPQRLHRRLQGHLPGRHLPDAGTSSPSSTPTSRASSSDKLDHPIGQLGDGRRPAQRTQAAAWTGLPEGIPVAVGNVDAHVTAPAADAIGAGPDGRDHGHLHLPRDEQRHPARGARACAASSTAASPPGSGATRPASRGVGDIFDWFVTTQVPHGVRRRGGRARHLRARAAHREGRRAGRSASTGWSRSTGTAATARCSSTTSSPA